MKLSNYVISQVQDEIQKFLFIKWLESDLDDWKDPELKDLYEKYHSIMFQQIEVVH